MLGEKPNKPSSINPSEASRSIDEMNELELMYQMCLSDGLELVGDPTRAFAAYDPTAQKLHVYAMNNAYVHTATFGSASKMAVLESAQGEGASFMASGDEVVCALKGVTAKGSTYAEAALRAIAKYQLSIKPE
ncbi:hypothetical protein D9M70_543300 [compost metagenome]